MALLLGNLLLKLGATLEPSLAGEQGADLQARQRAHRWRRARALSATSEPGELRRAFLGQVDELFAPLAAGGATSPAVLRARAYLDRHFTRRISLSELARAIHLSPNYLSSIFRKEMGVTVTQYLRQRRMRLAEQLLMEGRHTISEVAYQVGYQNYRDFHRNFVREGNRSPRTFLRLCRSRRQHLQAGSLASDA